MKDITGRALNIAQVRGASYADIRVVERITQHIAVKNGRVEALEQDESEGFGVRVIVNGACSSDLSDTTPIKSYFAF